MAKAKINKKALNDPVEKAFRQTMFALGRSFTEVISDPNAFADFSDQDLVDMGRFRASQQLQFPAPGRSRFSWNTEYAIYLLRGATRQNGTKLKGRDWIAAGLARSRVDEEFKNAVRRELG